MGTNFGIMNLKVQCQGNKFLKPCSVKARFSHGTQVNFPPVCTVEIYAFGSPHVRESVFQNLGNFCWWNPESRKILLIEAESWALESRIQLKVSGIPFTIGIQNPSSTDKDWNPVPGIRNPLHGIQNPRLSWIPWWGEFRSSSTRNQLNPPPRGGEYLANICVYVSRLGFETLTLFRTKNS